MAKTSKPIEIDGVVFASRVEAARAYGVSHATLAGRIHRNNKSSYTAAELGLENSTPELNGTSTVATMTWEFVYRQVASSPKPRRVDSIHYPFAA